MSVAIATARPSARLGLPRGRWVIAEHIARSAIKWAVVLGVLFGLIVMSTIESVTRAYPTLSQRLQLAQSSQSFAFIARPFQLYARLPCTALPPDRVT